MKLYNKKVNEFIDLVDSDTPTPGGGSSSALMSVLGLSLARMVGHLTVNKKKFKNLDENIQQDFNNSLISLLELKEKLIPLIDEDSESFNAIMKAFKLPKETEQEKKLRQEKINEATLIAIEIPFKVAKLSLEAFNYFEVILNYGNTSAISDLGVSVLSISSGVEGALYNVLINLIGFNDLETVNYYQNEVAKMLTKTHNLKEIYLKEIYKKLNFTK